MYKKILIKSEKDLPKEEGLYYCSYNDKIIYCWFRHKDWSVTNWLDNVSWYLIESPIRVPTGDEIEFEMDKRGIPNLWERIIGRSLAKWAIEEIIKRNK